MNIYLDNVLIFNEVIDGKDRLGQKTLHYKKIDNNFLLQMIGRVGRFKPGRAVIISDTPVPEADRSDPVARRSRPRPRSTWCSSCRSMASSSQTWNSCRG